MVKQSYSRKTVTSRISKLPLFLNTENYDEKIDLEIISNYSPTVSSLFKISKKPPVMYERVEKEKYFVYKEDKGEESDGESEDEEELEFGSQIENKVPAENVIDGFKVGTKIHKFSAEWEKDIINLKKLPKGIRILGKFSARAVKSNRENILAGDVKYLKGQEAASSNLLRSLALEMEKEDQVLIVSFKSTSD